MKDPVYVFLKIERDPEDSTRYLVSDILPATKSEQDLGSYSRSRFLDELRELKQVVLEGKVKIAAIKLKRSLTNTEDMIMRGCTDDVANSRLLDSIIEDIEKNQY